MRLPKTESLTPRLVWLDEVGSTNDFLRELAAREAELPNFTVIATESQTAGRGRLGREWVAPPGKTVAMSILVRDFEATGLTLGWLPLIAGSAVKQALEQFLLSQTTGVKWPNDVLVEGMKIAGILSEMQADGSVIVGIGINTLLEAAELPTDRATSLRVLRGAELDTADLTDRLISAVLGALVEFVQVVDVERTREIVASSSSTLGTQVRAHLPNGQVLEGVAVALADDGSLRIALPGTEAAEVVVAAGDIEHLR